MLKTLHGQREENISKDTQIFPSICRFSLECNKLRPSFMKRVFIYLRKKGWRKTNYKKEKKER